MNRSRLLRIMSGGCSKAFEHYSLLLFACIGFLLSVGQVQSQCDFTYGSPSFKTQEVQVYKDLSYSYGAGERQRLDAYLPAFQVCEKVDVLLLIHGGSFSGGSKQFMDNYALHFAQRGFFVFNMNYRLFFESHPAKHDKCEQLAAMDVNGTYAFDKAWYVALQDARAAVRYATQSLRNQTYEINNVFVFGISAGAITALNLALVDETDIAAWSPALVDEFGSIDAATPEPYRFESIDIAAVSSVSGTMGSLQNLTPKDSGTKLMFLHGFMDEVVNYDLDYCLPFHPGNSGSIPEEQDFEPSHKRLRGPIWMTHKIDSLDIPLCYEFYYSIWGRHNIYATFDRQIRNQIADFFYRVNSREKDVLCSLYSNQLGRVPFEPVFDINHSYKMMPEVRLSPNPTAGRLTVSFRSQKFSSGSIRIHNLQGRMMQEVPIDVWQGMNRSQLDVSGLPRGHYTLVLEVEDRINHTNFVRTNQAR